MQEEDPEKYSTHFASYIANDLEGDGLEEMYKSVSVYRCSLVYQASWSLLPWTVSHFRCFG